MGHVSICPHWAAWRFEKRHPCSADDAEPSYSQKPQLKADSPSIHLSKPCSFHLKASEAIANTTKGTATVAEQFTKSGAANSSHFRVTARGVLSELMLKPLSFRSKVYNPRIRADFAGHAAHQPEPGRDPFLGASLR